ncbi:hypothetical protein BM526_10560 [Alteromonas mediterranea]|uniref:DUF6174 domain-containing protein n=1 Tax=Alteromonas mediterranea TaxID=314275 RepID=UPI0009043285|nr:DUF6174 domain-containing protein [Alteromonas mediterranea]APE02251.1 hypothetical protein BM526_10560 [Alteromonas mediterranea]
MKSFVRFATTLIATTLLFGCGGSDSSNTLDELNKNRAKWENANIDSYQFEFRVVCFCLEDITLPRVVLVEGNQVVSQTIIESHVALPLDSANTESIDSLFDLIALEESRAESISVEYDEEFGFPTKIDVDINEQTADDEYILYVSNVISAEDVSCTTTVESGLVLSITDQSTQMPAACGVTVTTTEEAYTESVTNDEAACEDSEAISMLQERPGFYTLTVEKPGYQDYLMEGLGIGSDLCHVLTREVNVELIRE